MVIEKISEYITTKGISIYAFENAIGASRGAISKAIKEKKNIGSNVIENILSTYSDINPDWLFGHGPMLRPNPLIIEEEQKVTLPPTELEATTYYRMYQEERAENKKLLKEIGHLEERIHILQKNQQTTAGLDKGKESTVNNASSSKSSSSSTPNANSASAL